MFHQHSAPQAHYTPSRKRWWHEKVPWKTVLMILIGLVCFRLGVSVGNATPYRNENGQISTNIRYKVKQAIPGVIWHGGGGCVINGCGGYSCIDAASPEAQSPRCNFGVRAQADTCYQYAICERQPSGRCGWTETTAYQTCQSKGNVDDRTIDLNQDINEVY